MVNNFLFIEEGSVTTANLRKLIENSDITEASVIRYKKGCPKPELVTVKPIDTDRLIKDTSDVVTSQLLNGLVIYLNDITEKKTYRDVDILRGKCVETNTVKYYGTVEELIQGFREFLREKGE